MGNDGPWRASHRENMIVALQDFAVFRHTITAPLVSTSGGFDPLHVGHLRCLQQASTLGATMLVIVNGDGYLKRKKGYAFMPLEERAEILDALGCIDYVIPFESQEDSVSPAIEIIRPQIFAKGVSLPSPRALAEWEICRKVGCEVVLDVGGPKIRSSSDLVRSSTSGQQKAE